MEHKDMMMTTTKIVSKGEPTLTQVPTTERFAWTVGAPRTAYATGKTISLGDYQFARIGVRVQVEHSDDKATEAFEAAKFIAREITEQEAASVKSEDRENLPFTDGGFSKFEVTIDYGLTLKTGRFDSAKVDIALTRSTDGNLGETVSAMRALLASAVMDEAKEIKA